MIFGLVSPSSLHTTNICTRVLFMNCVICVVVLHESGAPLIDNENLYIGIAYIISSIVQQHKSICLTRALSMTKHQNNT